MYPPEPKPAAADKDKDKDKDSAKAKDAKDDSLVVGSSFSRGKGNVFLVDRASKAVIWSFYQRPRNASPDEMKHVADKIVDRLMNDAKQKKQ